MANAVKFNDFDEYFEGFCPHMMIYCLNGVGKTTLAGRTGLRTVLLDCGDSGVVTLKGAKNLKIVRIQSTSHYLDVMDKINSMADKLDLLVPDSISGLQSMAIKEVKGKRGEMNQRKWGQAGSKVIECLSETRAFPKNVLYLAQEKKRTVDEGEGDVTFISPNLMPSIRGFLSSSVDWIGRLYLEGTDRKLSFILSDSLEVKDKLDPPVFPKVLSLPPVKDGVYPAYQALRKRIVEAVNK